ncbi:MAG: M1 family peptidase [Flavobacteriaceae bacterium TMED120]|nr:MAG: M1 family peptidase [Flavobacteriaceae bacterium TMED120]
MPRKDFKYIALLTLVALTLFTNIGAQTYWQQEVEYTMAVNMDIDDYTYEGVQKLVYTNHSPDSLKKVFYHLYFNAFRPGSEMAIRQDNAADINTRFDIDLDSIPAESEGRLEVFNLKQDGTPVDSESSETILEVTLNKPLPPGSKTVFTLEFKGKVPQLIRRAGKNSSEGVALSMAQWYPKMAEYDYDGWNAAPYLGREFHGVWGDFDVTITLDKSYIVAASGYLQNADDIGYGYSDRKRPKSKKGNISWHFVAPNVHDFTWAADPNYIHDIHPGPNGVDLHFFYKNDEAIINNWKKLQPHTAELMRFYNKNIGPYPYKQYSVVQGGDGGMEYAMLTLITGGRDYRSLFGVTAHELAHSWFQHILATNEMKHEWMDEGFTSYICTLAEDLIIEENKPFPLEDSYSGYLYLATSGIEMPQSTNANRYNHNMAYESTAYDKGAVFLAQLGYIIGPRALANTLKEYYQKFKFTHPTPNDFRRVAEHMSNIQLKWYLTDWTQTTNRIDYSIDSIEKKGEKTHVFLKRKELMPMPLDVLVNYKDGTQEVFYIPIALMRGTKENPYAVKWRILEDWSWANPNYDFFIDRPLDGIESIIIDPTFLMADIDRSDNFYPKLLQK